MTTAQLAMELTLSVENWIFIAVGVAAAAAGVAAAMTYKRCPSDRILVIYGKVGRDMSHKCLHGGGAFVVPLIQDYSYLSLEPIVIDIPLEGARTRDGVRVNVPSTFTVAVSIDPVLMNNAAERLLNLPTQVIREQAQDIILGQLRLTIATLTIEEVNQDREKFVELININVGDEINKLGLQLINVNVRDITDESGYTQATGKRAVAEAIQSYLSRNPLKVGLDGARLRTKDGVTLGADGGFTFAVSFSPATGREAAEQLLNLPEGVLKERAREIVLGQVKLLVEVLTAGEIDGDRERFATLVSGLAGGELKKRGFDLLNVGIRAVSRPPT